MARSTEQSDDRGFAVFAVAQTWSFAGDGLRSLTVVLLVYGVARSAFWIGVVYALEFVPLAVLSVLAGRLADRLDRRRMLIACDFIRLIVLLAFAVAYLYGTLSLAAICAGALAMSAAATLFLAAQLPALSGLVRPEMLSRRISVLYGLEQTAGLLGLPLAGAVVGAWGLGVGLALNAGCYGISQITVAALPDLGGATRSATPIRPALLAGMFGEVKQALAEIFSEAASTGIIALQFLTTVLYFVRLVCIVPLLKGQLHFSDAAIGVSYGSMALLSLLAPLVVARRSDGIGRTLIVCYSLEALCTFALVGLRGPVSVVLLFSMCSALTVYSSSLLSSWRVRRSPPDRLGLLLGCVRSITVLGVLPGTLVGGAIADHAALSWNFALAGSGYVLAAAAVLGVRALREER